MRWILFSTIFANLLYFGWHQWLGQGGSARVEVQSFNEARNRVIDLPNIKLLSERFGYEEVPALKEAIAPTKINIAEIVSVQVADKKRCPVVGPFVDLDVATKLLQSLVGQGVKAELSEVPIIKGSDMWVVVPPLNSRREALRKLRELQGKGIDSYIITQGRLKNAISLGMFKRRESALGVQAKIKIAGYKAVIEEISHSSVEYWIEIGVNAITEKANKQILDIINVQTTLKFTQTLCE